MNSHSTKKFTFAGVVILLLAMAGLMIGPARQDSATVDETTFLSAGYTYWTGHRFMFVPEHPPLSQMLPALPLLSMDLHYSPQAQALLDGRAGYPWTRPWLGPIRAWQELFPHGRDNWYFWALPESQLFGQMFVYDGANDSNRMMFQARTVQIGLTLALALVVFLWVRQATKNDLAALAGLALWVFNPNALAHGHLVTTDLGAALGITAGLFTFARFLDTPNARTAGACGLATGFALVMKMTAVVLAPIYIVLFLWYWRTLRTSGVNMWKLAAILLACTWGLLLMIYIPRWSPPPPISAEQATALGVPGWFTALRPLLIPADWFKALGLTLGHAKEGHDAYFLGQWSHSGWLSFYPAVYFLKSPLAFVVATGFGLVMFLRHWRPASILERTAWTGAIIIFVLAATSNASIGIRHILPVLSLVTVGIGCSLARLNSRALKPAAAILIVWQAAVVLLAYPLYIQFFSEAVGGAANGQEYLVDSNFDWGQDANRLKTYLDEHHIEHIYLDYFGTQYNIEYLKIPNTRIDAERAKQITKGTLVVSASELMRPDWDWLRESHQPTARVAQTLFVYQLP